jgi:hypothetical protein
MQNAETVKTSVPAFKEWRNLKDSQIDEILEPMGLVEKLMALRETDRHYRYLGHLDKKYRAELMQMYMNTITTHYGAGGHKKAEVNKWLAEGCKEAMIELKMPIPSNEICFVLGQFNGKGSF